MPQLVPRVFRCESFPSKKDWVYFCLEFDLEICDGCFGRARRRRGDGHGPWFCSGCEPPLHTDLMLAIRTRSNVKSTCDYCGKETELKSAWISEDCARLYCSEHLEPVRAADIDRVVREETRTPLPAPRWVIRESTRRISARRNGVSPPSPSYRAIYDGDRVIELDRGFRHSS
ncbi:MAG: hypothetical protein AB7O52_16115 [Planctomycetota bacterium]